MAKKKTTKRAKPQTGNMKSLAKLMKGLDLCLMTTTAANGMIVSRPMSNNGDVDFDGTSYFFTWEQSGVAEELRANKNVNLGFQAADKTYISACGKAKLITNREVMTDHWNPDLEIWFEDGLDTEGILMIEVKCKRIKYWHKMEVVEVKVS